MAPSVPSATCPGRKSAQDGCWPCGPPSRRTCPAINPRQVSPRPKRRPTSCISSARQGTGTRSPSSRARTGIPVHGTASYTLPEGKALLESTSFNGDKPGTLKRIDMAGNEQFVYSTKDLGGAGQFSGDYLESPDGTQLVLGTANLGNEVVARSDNSLVVMGNDGSIIRTLRTPMPKAMCSPVKWSAPGVILTHCAAEGGGGEQLWKMPVDGGQPTALTA